MKTYLKALCIAVVASASLTTAPAKAEYPCRAGWHLDWQDRCKPTRTLYYTHSHAYGHYRHHYYSYNPRPPVYDEQPVEFSSHYYVEPQDDYYDQPERFQIYRQPSVSVGFGFDLDNE